LKQTTFETPRSDTYGIGSARSLRLKNPSQKKPSQDRDTALTRHTFRNVCTEANFGARIRYSDNVSGQLPTSTVVLPNCVHRPAYQVGISMPRDATDRPLPVSRSATWSENLQSEQRCSGVPVAVARHGGSPLFEFESVTQFLDRGLHMAGHNSAADELAQPSDAQACQ
jgi:hypothetical protein